jgi:hypothetical protein
MGKKRTTALDKELEQCELNLANAQLPTDVKKAFEDIGAYLFTLKERQLCKKIVTLQKVLDHKTKSENLEIVSPWLDVETGLLLDSCPYRDCVANKCKS